MSLRPLTRLLASGSILLAACATARGPVLVTIRGTVLNEARQPMADVQVFVVRSQLATVTDTSGHFLLQGTLAPGRAVCRVQKIGYGIVERVITVSRPDTLILRPVTMKPRAIEPSPYVPPTRPPNQRLQWRAVQEGSRWVS